MPLRFGPAESVFIVFRNAAKTTDRVVSVTRNGQELLRIQPPAPVPNTGSIAGDPSAQQIARGEIVQPGTYVFTTGDGRSREFKCDTLSAPLEIQGPWEVSFDPKWGGPSHVTFAKLDDWSKRPEDGIKYYSGLATYRANFHLDPEAVQRPGACWYRDLG